MVQIPHSNQIKSMKLYLSSYEYPDFEIPREILDYRKIDIDNRNCLLVSIDNPVIGQKYGLTHDVQELYLINRFDELAFDRLCEFPIDVYVLVAKSSFMDRISSIGDMENIAWACIYDNLRDAQQHKLRE